MQQPLFLARKGSAAHCCPRQQGAGVFYYVDLFERIYSGAGESRGPISGIAGSGTISGPCGPCGVSVPGCGGAISGSDGVEGGISGCGFGVTGISGGEGVSPLVGVVMNNVVKEAMCAGIVAIAIKSRQRCQPEVAAAFLKRVAFAIAELRRIFYVFIIPRTCDVSNGRALHRPACQPPPKA